jgi:hypothetical protein
MLFWKKNKSRILNVDVTDSRIIAHVLLVGKCGKLKKIKAQMRLELKHGSIVQIILIYFACIQLI